MDPFSTKASREAQIWAAIAEVNDPELDEPVTEMGFVERVAVGDDGRVEIDFRLPTYWCSPNFAFLMLDGLRIALEGLSWRPAFRITLHDHLFADEVNRGLAQGKGFSEIFEGLAPEQNLDELRAKFREKAFQRRQEAAIGALREAGWSAAAIVALERRALFEFEPGSELCAKLARYRQAFEDRFSASPEAAPAFVAWDGSPLTTDNLAAHLASLRSVRINMEFNGALCRGLKETRYREKRSPDGELTLVDFLPGARPRATGACAPP